MDQLLPQTVTGLIIGAAYAIAASGLVLTYSTTRVFNIAHGAFGMLFSFVFWDLSQKQGMNQWLALALVLLVIAPAFGIFAQRVLVRDLGNAPVGVSLVVTVGILVAVIGLATQIWPSEGRNLPPFFVGKSVELGNVVITYHELLTVALSAAVAYGLYVLLTRTRIGTAMRASVDNPDLLKLYGGRPQLAASLAWAIGSSLAALAGILLTPTIGLQYYDLTLLVISAYAAAMLGKLTNLPLTYVGAMALGLLNSYVIGYLPNLPFSDKLTGLPAVLPTLFLFLILVLLPQVPLRIGQVKGLVAAPVPSIPKAIGWGVALVFGTALLVSGMAEGDLLRVGTAAAFGIVMLSLVLLTGYGGFVSLAQLTFAGIGAVVYARLDQPDLLGITLTGLATGLVGALVAIPVIRLTGLYLALATLAFAQLMDKLVFPADFAYGIGSNPLTAERLSIFGLEVSNTKAYVVLMAAFFAVFGVLLIAVRRGRLGRILIALRDSQAAVGTLGLDQRWVRVGLFGASAGIAGVAGGLLAGLRGNTTASDFIYFNSLLVLLMAVVWGVTTVTGALLGGAFLMYLPVAQSENPNVAGLLFVLLGVGAVILARDPNGLVNKFFGLSGFIQQRVYPALAERYPGIALPRRRRADEDEYDDYEYDDYDGSTAEYQEEAADAVATR